MNNNSGAILFKIITTVAVIALLLSVSRLFLGYSDRFGSVGSYYFDYMLSNNAGMTTFIATILISLVSIIGGSYTSKRYDIIGSPLKYGGLISLILVTALTYLGNKYDNYSDIKEISSATSSAVLTIVIFIEWLSLIIYSWKSEEMVSMPQAQTPMTPSPVNNPPK